MLSGQLGLDFKKKNMFKLLKCIKCLVDIDIRGDIGCARSGNKPLLG